MKSGSILRGRAGGCRGCASEAEKQDKVNLLKSFDIRSGEV